MRKTMTVVAAVLLAGCSGGGHDDSAAEGSTPLATAPTTDAPARIPGVACAATRDSLDSAAIVYLVNGAYPTSLGELAGAYVVIPDGVTLVPTPAGDELQGPGWTLRMTGGGDGAPAFTCERS